MPTNSKLLIFVPLKICSFKVALSWVNVKGGMRNGMEHGMEWNVRTWNRNDSADIWKPRADIHFPFLFSVFHFPLSNFYF